MIENPISHLHENYPFFVMCVLIAGFFTFRGIFKRDVFTMFLPSTLMAIALVVSVPIKVCYSFFTGDVLSGRGLDCAFMAGLLVTLVSLGILAKLIGVFTEPKGRFCGVQLDNKDDEKCN